MPKDVPNVRAISLLPGWKPEPDSELNKIDPAILNDFIATPKSDPNTTIEEVDLEAKPTVETSSEDEKKEVERDDKQHPRHGKTIIEWKALNCSGRASSGDNLAFS